VTVDNSRLEAFRERVRTWLNTEAPRRGWTKGATDPDGTSEVLRAKECQRALFDAGLAGITWPSAFGGQELGFPEQVVFNEEAAEFDLPLRPFIIGLGMCGPTLLALGTEQQKARYLEPLLSGQEIWCQLFSEPGAGSDVASLATRAVQIGDEWVLNGQKVWTSGAQFSDFGLVLARTDPDVPKHKGLTMFVLDMSLPGIIIQPIKQMDGGARFNEVYLDGVRVDAASVIGDIGGGWPAALTTLANERVSLGAVRSLDDVPPAAELAALARAQGRATDPSLRQDLARVWISERIVELLGERVTSAILRGQTPGPEGSIAKLCRTAYTRQAADLGAQLAGPSAIAWDGGSVAADALLYTPCLSIAGGTDEVLRNVIGERVLGLPREPSTDRDRSFRELTRSSK
jgi:alkylation response protein AidB-like acyl-CoA dehydrogenase